MNCLSNSLSSTEHRILVPHFILLIYTKIIFLRFFLSSISLRFHYSSLIILSKPLLLHFVAPQFLTLTYTVGSVHVGYNQKQSWEKFSNQEPEVQYSQLSWGDNLKPRPVSAMKSVLNTEPSFSWETMLPMPKCGPGEAGSKQAGQRIWSGTEPLFNTRFSGKKTGNNSETFDRGKYDFT